MASDGEVVKHLTGGDQRIETAWTTVKENRKGIGEVPGIVPEINLSMNLFTQTIEKAVSSRRIR